MDIPNTATLRSTLGARSHCGKIGDLLHNRPGSHFLALSQHRRRCRPKHRLSSVWVGGRCPRRSGPSSLTLAPLSPLSQLGELLAVFILSLSAIFILSLTEGKQAPGLLRRLFGCPVILRCQKKLWLVLMTSQWSHRIQHHGTEFVKPAAHICQNLCTKCSSKM